MPLDRRLREDIGRLTSQVDPDVDPNLQWTLRRAHRTIAIRRAGAAIAVAASIAVAIVVVPRAIDALRDAQRERPATSPTASPGNTNPAVIAGTYEALIPKDQPAVRQNHLAGRWTIGLGTNGIMTVSAPSSFTGVLSGSLYQIQGDRFRTNLFVQDICSNLPLATYRWIRSGTKLSFTPIDDPCEGRVAMLTSAPWTRVG
jgi:hypothetical protein